MSRPTDPPEMIAVHGPSVADLPEPLARIARHRFISPHCDDVTLSCGGTVAKIAQSGHQTNVTVVFSAEPDPTLPLSPYAEHFHAAWGLRPGRVVSRRHSEEVVAAAMLGSNLEFLPFQDAIYRDNHYTNATALYNEPAVDEADLPEKLLAAINLKGSPESATRIYCPLAVGGHVDHRHAFTTGVKLSSAGWDVWFYEDQPYTLAPGALEARLTTIRASRLELHPIAAIDIAGTWRLKVLAITAYGSQVLHLFDEFVARGDPRTRVDRAMRSYARQIGDGRPCERFWTLAAGVTPG